MTSRVSASDRVAVVADTSPLNYLIWIDASQILPTLFASVVIPETVRRELQHPETPSQVRRWMAAPPPWLEVEADPGLRDRNLDDRSLEDPELLHLDHGEREAILLAQVLGAGLVLMDDRAGVRAALAKGLAVTGTIGLIDLAARNGLLDIAKAVACLRRTLFRARPALLDDLLARHGVS